LGIDRRWEAERRPDTARAEERDGEVDEPPLLGEEREERAAPRTLRGARSRGGLRRGDGGRSVAHFLVPGAGALAAAAAGAPFFSSPLFSSPFFSAPFSSPLPAPFSSASAAPGTAFTGTTFALSSTP